MPSLRYRLTDQLYGVRSTSDGDVFITVLRWDAVDALRPSAILFRARNGVETSRERHAGARGLSTVTAQISYCRRTGLTLAGTEAVKAYRRITGHDQFWCAVTDCGAPVPIGFDRCEEWHSVGRTSAGALSGVRRRPPIVLPRRGREA